MGVKIKVSYQTPQELQAVIKLLHPAVKSCKVSKEQRGEYKRAYVVLKV